MWGIKEPKKEKEQFLISIKREKQLRSSLHLSRVCVVFYTNSEPSKRVMGGKTVAGPLVLLRLHMSPTESLRYLFYFIQTMKPCEFLSFYFLSESPLSFYFILQVVRSHFHILQFNIFHVTSCLQIYILPLFFCRSS